MTHLRLIAAALAATTILGSAAYAADKTQAAPTSHQAQEHKAVDRDVVKLSADGAQAFRDLHLARIAIFNADPAQAKAAIGKADAAMAKAKTDETAFTKAEADLKPPANAPTKTTAPAAGTDMTKPVAWLPVDGQMVLAEDFKATPEKTAAVTEANKHLAKGDQKGAIEKLKLAGIDVNYTMAVVPLEKTTTDINDATKLIDQGKYYEANALLKQAEDGLRFDSVNVTDVPQKAAPTTAKAPAEAPAAPAAGTAAKPAK